MGLQLINLLLLMTIFLHYDSHNDIDIVHHYLILLLIEQTSWFDDEYHRDNFC